MKLLRSTFRLAWVFLLVLFVAGCFFAPALAFGSTEIDVTSVTNRYFADYDDYLDYVEWAKNQTYQIDEQVNATQYDLTDAQGQIGAARHNAVLALHSLGNIILDPDEDYHNWMRVQNSITRLQAITNQYEQAISDLNANSAALNDIKSTAAFVRSSLNTNLPTYQIVVDGYSGGGGCSCPDYSTVLNQICNLLQSIHTSVTTISSKIEDALEMMVYETAILWNFFYSAEESLGNPDAYDDYSHGLYSGQYFGTFLSNYVAYAVSLNRYASGYGLTYDSPVHYGSPAMQEIWNWILLPYAQLLLPNTDSHNTDNRMVNAIRDFYIEPTVWVTNSYIKPLWVNMMTNGIGGSAEHPILVELTSSGSHVSVDNPVWVQFTNSVYIDATSLSSITNFALDINWSPLYDLTNSVWMVTVLNSNDLAGAILDEEQRRAADAIDDMDDTAPEEETADLPTTSFGFASSVANSIKSVATSYKTMFNSIPSDPPWDITMWQGVTLYGVEVPSVHWRPSEYSACTSIRKLFSFAWYLVYIWVIFVTAAIDLCVCGVIVYMVYGLLLGKQEVAYNGMLWCFKTLASFLGYKPQSAK